MDGLGCRVTANTGNNRDTPGTMLDRNLDKIGVVVHVDRRRFASSTNDNKPVGTLLDMPVDEFAIRIEIETGVSTHRRNESDQTALKDRSSRIWAGHKKTPKTTLALKRPKKKILHKFSGFVAPHIAQ